MIDPSPKIPETPAEFVAWLNHPWPSEFIPTGRTPKRVIERKGFEIEEGALRDQFAELIEILNVRPEDVPPGYRLREPREKWLEARRFFGDHIVNNILGTFPLYFQRCSGQAQAYKVEPGREVSGFQRRQIMIALVIVSLDQQGLLRTIRRCSVCDEKRWFEARDRRKKWCRDLCRKRHHKDEQVLRERAARTIRVLPSHWNDLVSRGYIYLGEANCPGCQQPVQWWRTPLRKTGRRGRPPATMDIPLERIQGTDGPRVRHHIDHFRLEELKREREGVKNVDHLPQA
jgi:hypothetical protein